MGLSWQQGPLSPGAIGRFLVPESLPKRLLYTEPLRRRVRVRFGGTWIADSENVLLLFEPGRYPVAYFPKTDISPDSLQGTEHTTRHPDLGLTSWYAVRAGGHSASREAWQHIDLPAYASELQERVAFAWTAMDAFYEEDERILGHAADSYHRIDIRQTSRSLVVRHRDRIIADIHPRIIKGTYSLELCHYLDRRWHGSASPGAASEHTSTFAPIDEGSRARRVLPCGEATASRCAECGGPQQRRDRENSQIAAIQNIGVAATLRTTRY